MKNAKKMTRRQREELEKLGWGSAVSDFHFIKETKEVMHVYYKPLGKPLVINRYEKVSKDEVADILSTLVE